MPFALGPALARGAPAPSRSYENAGQTAAHWLGRLDRSGRGGRAGARRAHGGPCGGRDHSGPRLAGGSGQEPGEGVGHRQAVPRNKPMHPGKRPSGVELRYRLAGRGPPSSDGVRGDALGEGHGDGLGWHRACLRRQPLQREHGADRGPGSIAGRSRRTGGNAQRAYAPRGWPRAWCGGSGWSTGRTAGLGGSPRKVTGRGAVGNARFRADSPCNVSTVRIAVPGRLLAVHAELEGTRNEPMHPEDGLGHGAAEAVGRQGGRQGGVVPRGHAIGDGGGRHCVCPAASPCNVRRWRRKGGRRSCGEAGRLGAFARTAQPALAT